MHTTLRNNKRENIEKEKNVKIYSDLNQNYLNIIFFFLSALEDLVLSSMSSSHCAVRGAMWTCNHCGKEDKDKNNMRRHVESHFNFKHTCNYCGKVFKSRPSMQSHISRKHKDDA